MQFGNKGLSDRLKALETRYTASPLARTKAQRDAAIDAWMADPENTLEKTLAGIDPRDDHRITAVRAGFRADA